MELAQYQFTLKYIKGCTNVGPDFFSKIEPGPIKQVVATVAAVLSETGLSSKAEFDSLKDGVLVFPADTDWIAYTLKDRH